MSYRLRDYETRTPQAWQPEPGFNPLFYTPPDDFFLEVMVGGCWVVYTKPTLPEMVSNIQTHLETMDAHREMAGDALADLARMLQSEDKS